LLSNERRNPEESKKKRKKRKRHLQKKERHHQVQGMLSSHLLTLPKATWERLSMFKKKKLPAAPRQALLQKRKAGSSPAHIEAK